MTTCLALLTAGFPAAAYAQQPRGMGRVISDAMYKTAGWAGFLPPIPNVPRTFIVILGSYTNGIITILGLVFLVLVIFGGFKWMTAGGNEEQVTKAKGFIKNAAIGLTIILTARVFTFLLLEIIQPAVTP